eukprot:TRINITY_DN18600_c0_g1_i1.p1 TRINITY_DN18600_c0_g1~~TRINITY_DN18600_c0_g1_i1.p1  ORF type:complete len:262 (+),score=52.80 TRINITY_DN18600_c0_g1_i1:768-1553(+)
MRTIRHSGQAWGEQSSETPRLVKMVLSATLSKDPSKISRLCLHHPLYIASTGSASKDRLPHQRYSLPKQLKEFKLVCTAGEKPLYLVALLQRLLPAQSIVFTASVEATHRLFLLLQAFDKLPFKAVEYSSLQQQRVRSAALQSFRRGEVEVLVASDAMTRGMDVENVANVVSYDSPVYAKTYVHRVGRTARAGRAGSSFTMLRGEEVRHFKGMLRKMDNNLCKDYKVPAAVIEDLTPRYVQALEALKGKVEEETALQRKQG